MTIQSHNWPNILTKITEDSRLLLVGLVRLTFISYTGPFVTWRRLRSIFEQSEEKTFFSFNFELRPTWLAELSAWTSLYLRFLVFKETLTKGSVSGFLSKRFAKTAISRTFGPFWPITHVTWKNQWNNIANNKFWNWLSSPSYLQELFIKTLYQTVPALPLQGTNGSHGVELEAQVNESSRLSQEYPWGRSIRVGVHDLCFR